eukprot:488310-Prymnesium_polylepis.1
MSCRMRPICIRRRPLVRSMLTPPEFLHSRMKARMEASPTPSLRSVLPARYQTVETAYVAFGILSTAKKEGLARRKKIRAVASGFSKAAVEYRFVLGSQAIPQALADEAAAQHDIVILNMSEAPFRCGIKYIVWISHALAAFPRAKWIAVGDDDAFVQMEHLEADLRRVTNMTAGAPALWGLIMWRAYYNNVTLDTTTGFTVRAQALSTLCAVGPP